MRGLLLCLLVALLSACELREITTTEAEDVVIAEVILRAGDTVQTAYLHRTATGGGLARVENARIVVRDVAHGTSFTYVAEADSLCLRPAPPPDAGSTGTCYAARGAESLVRPGARYTLRIDLADGGVLTGTTIVPGTYTVVTPASAACTLQPRTTIDLTWTKSAGTAVYIVGARMRGLREALIASGVPVEAGSDIELVGLSVSAADTTIMFPSELGLFDRFDEELHPVLLAIRDGLPEGVVAEIGIAAADPNYVNWVRGGNFNPSGSVRISSLDGAGHGVFGSQHVREAGLHTPSTQLGLPPCR